MQPLRHIPDVLDQFKKRSKNKEAYNLFINDDWVHYSSERVLQDIEYLALALHDSGVKKGDRIAISAKSSPNWSIVDFAIILNGAITVPFFANLSKEHFLFEMTQAGPIWIFVGDEECWQSVESHRYHFQQIISLENQPLDPSVLTVDQLIARGRSVYQKNPELIENLKKKIEPEDLATIIYSSGSTGNPKGVELTHKNLVSIIHLDEFGLHPGDKYLNILPLAHIFAKQIHLIMTAWGIPVYFLNELKKIPDICQKVPITLMITVPKVLEKAYTKIQEKIKNASFFNRMIGTWALNLAHRKESLYKEMMHPIADKLVYSKIRNGFGKNFRTIVSGGAALNPRIHQFYLSVGIPIIQGWGLTEASTICINRRSDNQIGTVGVPLENTEFKISDEGEVFVKGPTVMRGYYKNPEETKKVLDADGWLHTGDLGYFNQRKHLVILGRKSESFKTSQGEFINPIFIEQKLVLSPFVEVAMVIGEALPYATALLFPDHEHLQSLKNQAKVSHLSDEEYLKSNEVKSKMALFMEQVNQTLDEWQQIHDYRFVLTPLSIEKGELTPTLKLRRKVVLKKYQDLIQSMYAEASTHHKKHL